MGTRSTSNGVAKVELGGTISNVLDSDSTGTVSVDAKHTITLSFTSGTTANKADRIWHDKGRTLAQNASESLDLYDLGSVDIGAGAGLDALGQSWAIAEVVGVLIHNKSDSSGNLLIGGEGSAAAWNSLFNASDSAVIGPIYPDGWFAVYNPADPAFLVADSSNHLLKIAEANVGSVEYDITIIGRSA